MREHEAEFRAKNANIAAIGLGNKHYARLFREETGITFPLLVDGDRKAYRAAGLKTANLLHIFRNNEARAKARAQGFRQVRIGRNPFQLGGSFVFAPGNRDLFTHVSSTFGDNAAPEALLAVL